MKAKWPLEDVRSERLSGEESSAGEAEGYGEVGAHVQGHALRWWTFVNGGGFYAS